MPIAALPAIALLAGALLGIHLSPDPHAPLPALGIAVLTAIVLLHRRGSPRVLLAVVSLAFAAGGVAVGADATRQAIDTSLRVVLDREFGGFTLESHGPEGRHDPLPVRAVLLEDAAHRDDYVSLRAEVEAVFVRGAWTRASGAVTLSVSGEPVPDLVDAWRAGRTIEAPVTFRRASRYLNDGVPDHERLLALSGTTLLGSIKSGLLVEVIAPGSAIQEAAARARAYVRAGARRWIAPHDALSGAIVVAILIGDRTGLPAGIRERLQAAGTYHVIAISGGNIAILAGVVVMLFVIAGIQGRLAAAAVVVVLLGYGQIVTPEPSVWRATLMGTLYFGARLLDHRTSPGHAIGVAAALMVTLHPLDARSPGFILSFGATVALLEGARRGRALLPRRRVLAWLMASVIASFATEAALLPVTASLFSRVTSAGLVLNLLAVPLMTVVQVAGMVATLLQPVSWIAAPAGWVAHIAAVLLVETARLVDVAPWLAARVPSPHPVWVAWYYAAFALVVYGNGRNSRAPAAICLVAATLAIWDLLPSPALATRAEPARLRITVFDVGQAEAVLVQPPRGRPLLVDAAGAPFGGGTFDIGGRVLAPALWARGVRSLAALVVTHGHPDHIGGAAAVLRDVRPDELWHGVPVPGDEPSLALFEAARRHGTRVEQRLAGDVQHSGGLSVRVLHPPAPDWERREVRNDDSIVLELVFRDVAVLLTGDIGADVERAILPQLTPAPRRVLKVAHHGSRTSSSAAILEYWRPDIALISAGRGNTFNHPAVDVVHRLERAGAMVVRTDLHGQITIDTDGRTVQVRTFAQRIDGRGGRSPWRPGEAD